MSYFPSLLVSIYSGHLKLRPFLNPPHNFSFHFTLPEQQHFLCPRTFVFIHSSSVCHRLSLPPYMGITRAGVCSGQADGVIWNRSRWLGFDRGLSRFSVVFLLWYGADVQSRTRCPRLSATHLPLLYSDASLVGVMCVILPPLFCLFRGALHGLVCQPSCNSRLSGHKRYSPNWSPNMTSTETPAPPFFLPFLL